MIKFYILIIILSILHGCGSSSDTQVSIDDTNISEPLVIDEYYNTQWYSHYDEEFYNENFIDSEAHIHPHDVYDTYSGKGVKVAVIDDGFDITHPELKDNIIKTVNYANTGLLADVSHTHTDEYHGTSVAGIIAAKKNGYGVIGISPNVQLILIKMGDYNTDTETIGMFKSAVDAGADVINCSWGTGSVSDTVKDYIDYISQNGRDGKGVIVVFASGNDDSMMTDDESAIESVVGVGATDHLNLRTTYSNFGEELDVVAPGGGEYYGDYGISTIDPVGTDGATDNDYNLYDEIQDGSEVSFIGTSAAAPIVTGAIALVLEANPDLTRIQIQNLLKTTSDKIGLNVPYLEDNVVINTTTPTFQGLLGSSNSSNFMLKLTSNDGTLFGPYNINVEANSWSSTVTESLNQGFYKAELYTSEIIRRQEVNTTIATDTILEINLSKEPLSYSTRNDYYGYGKINLSNLIQGSLELK